MFLSWPLVAANVLWSGNFVLGRVLARRFGGLELNALRWTVAAFVLLPTLLREKGRRSQPIPWKGIAVLSATGILAFNSLAYSALHTTTATRAALLNALTPLFTLLISRFLNPAPLRRLLVMGTVLSILGVALVVGGFSLRGLVGGGFRQGDWLMLLAALSWAIYTARSQDLLKQENPLRLLAWSVLLALPAVDALGLWQALDTGLIALRPVDLLGILYVGVFASVLAFTLWSEGVARLGAKAAAPFLNLLPLFTAGLAVATLGERPGLPEALGGLFIILGVTAGLKSA